MVETAMGTGKDTFLRGLDPRQSNPSASASSSAPGASLPANLAPEVELELERLRVERDAMAAELQAERAERLRAEERLRLLEREKLEQMRQAAAAREQLASELEEARLHAMRAEARQAAHEADTRLAEIGSRRRGALDANDAEPAATADEIADGGGAADEGVDAPDQSGDGARWVEQPASQASPPAASPRRPGAGSSPSARTGGAAGRAGEKPSRPTIDRAQLEARLTAGAVIQTTERFRQFQPVAQSHIKVCDWLAQASTYGELQAKAAGQLPESELLDVLALLLERSFLVLQSG